MGQQTESEGRFPEPVTRPRLLDQVRDAIRRKHYSIRTEQAHVFWIKRYIIFHNKRHPLEMAETEFLDGGLFPNYIWLTQPRSVGPRA